MKKVGIVGGVGWASTVDYYQAICRWSQDDHVKSGRPGTPATPEMSIESLDLATAVARLGRLDDEDSWSSFDIYHREALQRLEASGVDFALIASNTPHHRFDAITAGLRLPVLNIFDVIVQACSDLSVNRVLVLGTALTMASNVLPAALRRIGVTAFAPELDADREDVLGTIALLQSGAGEGTAAAIGRIAQKAHAQFDRAKPTVCLVCTELPLAFPGMAATPVFKHYGVTYLNSAALHARAAYLLARG